MSSKSRTKVINDTGADVILKLSTGGIISKLSNEPLVNGDHYYISIDLTTTYREYWCAVQPNAGPNTSNDKVILNSDDCAEYSEVTLTTEKVLNGSGNEVTRYKWVGTKCRDPKKNKTLQSSSSASSSPALQNCANGSQVSPSSTPLNDGSGNEVTRYKRGGTKFRDPKKNRTLQGSSSASSSPALHNYANGSQVTPSSTPLKADRTTIKSRTRRSNSRCTIL